MIRLKRKRAIAAFEPDIPTASRSQEITPAAQPHDSAPPVQRSLFRQEVLDFQRHTRQWGRVVPMQPLPLRITAWLIAASVALIVTFLFTAQYARKETALGYLVPAHGTAKVFPPQAGTISAVHIAHGQHVEQGQPLLTVSTQQIAGGGEDVHAAILMSLEQQKQALTHQIASEVRRTASERERLAAQLRQLESELGHLVSQTDLQRERIRLAEAIAASGAALASKGLVSELDQKHREEAVLEQRRSLVSLMEQISVRQREVTGTRATLEQLPFTQAEKIQLLRNELATTEQRLAEATGRRAYVIRAPISGRIGLLQASIGQPANPQRLQLEIIPADSPLQAELFVPPRAIGFVEVGQPVRLLYDAFPYQQFGTYQGQVIKVSHTALMGSEISTPITLRDPAYKVTVSLARPDIDAYGKKIPLQPDMLLKADIILERRTLVEWILSPLRSLRIQG